MTRHRSRRRVRALTGAGLIALLATAGIAAGPVSAALPPVRFEPVIGACNPRGTATPNLTFRLTIRSKAGALKLDRSIKANGSGSWSAPCGADVATGDVFTAKANGTTIRTFTVPRIGLTIDRDADLLVGTAPKAQTVSVVVRSCKAQSMGCSVALDGGRDVTADGLWDWPVADDVDLRGTDDVTITWNGPKGDHVEATFYPPMLRAQRGSASVFVTGLKPGAAARVTLRRNGSPYATMSTTASRFGYASGDLKRDGAKVPIKVGDVLSLVGVAGVQLTVIGTTIAVGPSGMTASGSCYADGTGAVSALTTSGDSPFSVDGTGAYAVDLVSELNGGDQVLLICATPAGDTLWRTITID